MAPLGGYGRLMPQQPARDNRWSYPAEGETSADIDREMTDAESVEAKQSHRTIVNPQVPAGAQGLSSDSPGTNPAEVRRHEDGNVADVAGSANEDKARRTPPTEG